MTLPSGVSATFGTDYTIVSIDLGIERRDVELEIVGDRLTVIAITGELSVKLHEKDEPPIDLHKISRLSVVPKYFERLFLTNIAQSGKSALVYVGKAASFESEPKILANVGVLNVADERINPAQEDGNLAKIADDMTSSLIAIATGLDETSPQSITLDSKGKRLLEIYGKATASTTFRLDCSPDNVYWITDYKVYSAIAEVKDTLWNGFRYVRLRSDAAGVAGDTVDLVLSAK